MSRSNGPAVPPGGVPTRPPRQLNQPMPQQPQGAPGPSDQLSQHAYRQPQPQQRPQAQAYAPQFDPYQPQQPAGYVPPPQQQTYANPQAFEQPPLSQPAAYAQPQQTHAQPAAPAPRAQVPAYDQWTAPAQPLAQDPRGYDLGGYSAPPQDAYQQQGYAPAQQNDWGQQQYGQQGQEPSLDASAYHPDQQAYQQGAAQDQQGEYAEDEEGYEAEAAPRGRFLRIAAALAGAIVVGGGLAFAYTSLIAPGNGSLPVIKSASGPNKIKPADAGGKKFANSDKKLMGQLNDGANSGDGDVSGVKRVGTVQVAADGSIIPPAEKPAEVAKATEPDTSFPATGATLAGTPPATTPVVADAPVTINPPKALDKVADKAVKVAAAEAPDAMKSAVSTTTTNSINAVAAAVKPAAPAALPVKKVAAAVPAAAAATAAATAPSAVKKAMTAPVTAVPTGAGYVAVLASVPVSTTSRINALKQFADMQQKFGPVLQNKTPDVKEANLGDKGNYHRLLVGPPSSREGAQALCGSLKAAGYASDCWVTAY